MNMYATDKLECRNAPEEFTAEKRRKDALLEVLSGYSGEELLKEIQSRCSDPVDARVVYTEAVYSVVNGRKSSDEEFEMRFPVHHAEAYSAYLDTVDVLQAAIELRLEEFA